MNLIKEYSTWASQFTNASARYHKYCAIFLISQCLSNRVWIPFGGRQLHPNLMVCLIGPARISRKSTCIKLAQKIMTFIDPMKVITPEQGLYETLEELEKTPQGGYFFEDIRAWIGYLYHGGKSETFKLLKAMHEGADHLKYVVHHQQFLILNPCLGILGALRDEDFKWLTWQQLGDKNRHREFFSNFILVFGGGEADYKPHFKIPDLDSASQLALQFKPLLQAEGQITLDRDAEEVYNEYHRNYFETFKRAAKMYGFSFLEEIPTQVLKLAMCMVMNEGVNYNITKSIMQEAILMGYNIRTETTKFLDIK